MTPNAFINFQAMPDSGGLKWIFNSISRSTQSFLKKQQRWHGNFVDSIGELCSALKAHGRLTILFDEADALSGHKWGQAFLGNLNHLLFNDPTTSRVLRIAIAGGVGLERLSGGMSSSPLLMRLEPIALRNFTDPEADELIRRANLKQRRVTNTNLIKNHTGRHPALMQFVLGKLQTTRAPLERILHSLDNSCARLFSTEAKKLSESAKRTLLAINERGVLSNSQPKLFGRLEQSEDVHHLTYSGLVTVDRSKFSVPVPFKNLIRKSHPHFPAKRDFDDVAGRAETPGVELKASFFFDVKEFITSGKRLKNKDILKSAIQAILGFLNAEGGLLIVGIHEGRGPLVNVLAKNFTRHHSNFVVGLEEDWKLVGHDWDGLKNAILDHLREKVDPVIGQDLNFEVTKLLGKSVVFIRIPSASKYFFYENEFYVRVQERTQRLTTKQAMEYQQRNPR